MSTGAAYPRWQEVLYSFRGENHESCQLHHLFMCIFAHFANKNVFKSAFWKYFRKNTFCYTSRKLDSCLELQESDIEEFYNTVKRCAKHWNLYQLCEHNENACARVPGKCSDWIMRETFYRLVSINAFQSVDNAIYTTAFLPLKTYLESSIELL